MIDNYDSFTYNLVHYLEAEGATVDVYRNDKISLEEALNYSAIILSPGPGLPKDAGIMPALIKQLTDKHKLLGICLGHQAIGEAFGSTLFNMDDVYHGVATNCEVVQSDSIFDGLPNEFEVGRYHSWSVCEPVSDELEVLAKDKATGTIMALRHKTMNIRGLQFHPESILTQFGKEMIKNWINIPTTLTR